MLVAPAPPEMYGMPYRSGTTLCACTSWDPYPPITAWTFCCAMSCSTSWALRDASEVSSRRERSIFSFFPPTSSPPASFTSFTAYSVAALKAPPILDSLPVTGRTAPMRIVASSVAAARTGGTDEVSASARAERTRERFQRMPVIEASNAARAAITDVRKREGTSVGPGGRGRAGRAGVPSATRSEVHDLHLDRELVRRVPDLGGHALVPELDVEVVLGLRVRVEVEPCDVPILVLAFVNRLVERLLLVPDDRGDLRLLDEDARLDRERAFLGESREERAAVDVLVRDRRLEGAEVDREVQEHVGRSELVGALRVVGRAEREDLPVAVVHARERGHVVDLGVEEVPLEAFREARRVLDAGLAEALEEQGAVLETVAEKVAPEHEAGVAPGVGLELRVRRQVVGRLVQHERGRAARDNPAVDRYQDLAELDVELLGDAPLADGVEEVEARAKSLRPRRGADGLRRLAEVRVLGLAAEANVIRDLAADEEAHAANEEVLLIAAAAVVRGVRDLLEVRLRLEEEAEFG